MAVLLSEIQERIAKPKQTEALKRAKFDNDWCRFHARISTTETDTGDYRFEFQKKIRKILTDESKRSAFFDLMPYPFPTTQFISEAMDELNKIFYANDREINVEFNNEELNKDFEVYLDESLQIDKLIDRVYNLAFESPNAVLIFDSVLQEGDTRPMPYVFVVQPRDIIDIEVDATGEIILIVFSIKEDEIVALDSGHYRLFLKQKDSDAYYLHEEVPHFVGYCPACYVWPDMIEGHNGYLRAGPIVPELARLDRILRSEIFEEHGDLGAGHPIMQIPKEECEIEGCEGGYISRINGVSGQTERFACSCQRSNSIGPGSTIQIPTSAMVAGIGKVVQFIEVPVASLEYFTGKVDKLKQQSFLALTGGNYSQVTTQAINEKQVQQGMDRKRNRYIYISEMIEQVHEFILNTCAKIRYADAYKGALVKYGVEFELETLTDAVERYNMLKNAAMPQYIIGQQLRVVENLYSQSNYDYAQRSAIIRLIEPYRNTSVDKLPVGSLDYEVKLRFLELIDEFEMKNGPIAYWGPKDMSLEKKVEAIKKQIYAYAKESLSNYGGQGIGQVGRGVPVVP